MTIGDNRKCVRPVAIAWLVLPLLFLANHTVAEPAEGMCAGKPAVSPGDYTYELESGGYTRNYRVHVPPGYSTNTPAPVVMVFHGGWGTGKYIQKQSKMNAVSDQHGFIGVFPDGKYRAWNAGGCCEKPMRKGIDDVGFVRDMINKLEQDYCVDSRRIYATGFSNGAMLSHRLACELSDKIAAVAPVSGVIMVKDCKPQRPMAIMEFHGTDDPRSLWEGGLGAKDPSKGVRDSIPVTLNKLTTRYHCSSEAQNTFKKGSVSCDTYGGCDGGEVSFCTIGGGGHQWPGGEGVWEGKLGPVNRDISASEMMWEFFSKHPMADTERQPEKQAAQQ
ncbi:MAG: hypothetical protein H6985_19520 [Pseudomonadales bacterium]|nr:hypothetical protein [Halioglobus sp.]MCP5131761.1 hypothetical protein [Pseudomonadales bacterium]